MTAQSQRSPIDPAAQHHLERVAIEPPVELAGGRNIRIAAEAVDLLREHEARPGVDDRDEVLHALERAESDDEKRTAVERFRAWVAEGSAGLPVSLKPYSTRGEDMPPTDLS